jgi:hypothetical protein
LGKRDGRAAYSDMAITAMPKAFLIVELLGLLFPRQS